jgi:hypothetical protein
MLAPAFGPMALAHVAKSNAMHCVRQRVSPLPAPPCHQGMAESNAPQPESSSLESSSFESQVEWANAGSAEASLRAVDNCCQNHDCCCRIATTQRARPASTQLYILSPLIEPARPPQIAARQLKDVSACDSARAPPRSSLLIGSDSLRKTCSMRNIEPRAAFADRSVRATHWLASFPGASNVS